MFVMPRKFLLTIVLFVYADAATLSGDEETFVEQQNRFANVMRVEELLEENREEQMNNVERNEHATLDWARKAMAELRLEMREIRQTVNNSVMLNELHDIRNELKQALLEAKDMVQLARTQEARVDKLDGELNRIKYEHQQMRTTMVELKNTMRKMVKEAKAKQFEELEHESNNVIEMEPAHAHKYRHNKMIHTQIARLAKNQDQIDAFQQGLQTQILDVQRRLDRYEEPNWYLLSAKVEFLELETKVLRQEIKNTSKKAEDFDKIHASMLELREEVENIENKADATLPEFRKEISKIDVNIAQIHAQMSYIKEDQENLRQSVKAIAVSVSNAVDRAESDRSTLMRLSDTIQHLSASTKQHYHRLNDHIHKSEANNKYVNESETIPLPELMGEVKELEPVKREYEDLVSQLPRNCSVVKGTPGTYLIRPGRSPVEAWCSHGSTVIQRRYNGSVEFNRKYNDYVQGFGDSDGEYWIGLQNMHLLSIHDCSSMRIDMTDIYGGHWYAEYEYFSVGSAETGYVLKLGNYKGNASDAFDYQNHMQFSAIDRDRDTSNSNCAANYEGGWWYSHCQHVNINGKYSLGLTWFDGARNEWIAVAGSEMRVFPRRRCTNPTPTPS